MSTILFVLGIYCGVAGFYLVMLNVFFAWMGFWIGDAVSVKLMIQRSVAWPHTTYLIVSSLWSKS